jgi:ribosomal protein L7/L12
MFKIKERQMSELENLKAKVIELETKINFLYKKLNITEEELSGGVDPRIIEELKKGNKIEAIKIYRELFNTSLVVAKDAVEAIQRNLN